MVVWCGVPYRTSRGCLRLGGWVEVEGRKHPDLPASGVTRYLIPFLAQDPSPAPAVVGPAEQLLCFAFLCQSVRRPSDRQVDDADCHALNLASGKSSFVLTRNIRFWVLGTLGLGDGLGFSSRFLFLL